MACASAGAGVLITISPESFVESVQGYVNLKNKKNSSKRIAIFYFKGPGQNALTASGMEVVPSLYNLLVRLKNEGYNVGKLPANPQELAKMIQAQGAVFGTYAEGAYTQFLQSGHPALVTAQQFAGWTQKALSKKMIKEMNQLYGSFPGKYMDVYLGVECENMNELTGMVMAQFERYLQQNPTDVVIVVDDLASTIRFRQRSA